MAEGGIAAALGNVDADDDWRTHFRDTMQGGKMLNNWRMAQIHAQESGERVRELEQWGALFDRTEDGQNPAARLRRPHLPAPLPRRRPHRPRADPHPPGPRRPDGDRRVHGVRGHPAPEGRRPDRRRLRLLARAGALRRLQGPVGHPRHGRDRQGLADHVELLGVHGRRDGARLRRGRRAHRHGVRAVPSHRDGLAAGRPGDPRDRGRARRRRNPDEQARRALHAALRPGEDGPLDARRRGARDLHRGQGRPRHRARRRLPRHLAEAGRLRQAQAPEHVPPVPGARRRGHHERADGGRTRPATT